MLFWYFFAWSKASSRVCEPVIPRLIMSKMAKNGAETPKASVIGPESIGWHSLDDWIEREVGMSSSVVTAAARIISVSTLQVLIVCLIPRYFRTAQFPRDRASSN